MLPTLWMQATVVADPELRFTPGGKAVCNIRLVANDRQKKDGQWVDGDPLWVRGTAWERLGENVADSVRKGDQVVAGGRMYVDEFERPDGSKSREVRLHLFELAVSNRIHPVASKRTERTSAQPEPEKGGTPSPADVFGSEGGDLAPPPL